MHSGLGIDAGVVACSCSSSGCCCGTVNGVLVAYARLQPILVTLATLAILQGLAIKILPEPGGSIPVGYSNALANPGGPWSIFYVVAIAGLWLVLRRTATGVADLRDRQRRVRRPRPRDPGAATSRPIAYALAGTLAAASGLFLAATTTAGDAAAGRRLRPHVDRGRRPRRRQLLRRARQRARLDRRRVHPDDPHERPLLRGHRPALPVVLPGALPLRRSAARKRSSATSCGGAHERARRPSARIQDTLTRDRRRTLVAFAFAVIVFVVGAFLHSGFASWGSVSAILEVASFVGFVAAGQTFVILVGGIDLSVPWVLNAAGDPVRGLLARPQRARRAGGSARARARVRDRRRERLLRRLSRRPGGRDDARDERDHGGPDARAHQGADLRDAATRTRRGVLQNVVHKDLLGIPADLILWLGVAALASVVLAFTTYGRKVYAIGNNPTAAYLAGVNVRLVTSSLYGLSGMFAALAGIVLVSYSGQPTLGMGDPYLFQSIAAAVIGGISILGGRGNYLGTVAGAVSLVALISLLQAENMPDYGRSIVYGVAILVVLVLFGREERV